jgi:hypothetical protein
MQGRMIALIGVEFHPYNHFFNSQADQTPFEKDKNKL